MELELLWGGGGGGAVVIPMIKEINTDFLGLFQTPDITLTCQMEPNALWLIYSALTRHVNLAAKHCLQK